MKKLLFLLNILILSVLTSCVDKEGEPSNQEYFNIDYSTVGNENGYEYVDLGLSVKWATCNLGASSPEELGDKYAWGEVQTKQEFTWDNYMLCKDGDYRQLTKYVPQKYSSKVDLKNTQLDFEDDAARVHWGGTWAIPTASEIKELMNPDNCTWIRTWKNEVPGFEVISNINGNSIFIPFTTNIDQEDYFGIYWSSTIVERVLPRNACAFYLQGASSMTISYERCWGWYIRPVLL